MALREGPPVQHLKALGAVACGAVVSHPAEVAHLLRSVYHPTMQEHGDILHVPHHRAIRELQVICGVPIAAACGPIITETSTTLGGDSTIA